MSEPTEELFLKDVSSHEMKILLDSGVYRHLRFKQPGSSVAWFDIVTFPGHLAYVGDMGSFTFARLEDMFGFFRSGRQDDKLYINLSYWGEKLEAVDNSRHHPGHRQFSPERFKRQVEEHVRAWIDVEELTEVEAKELRDEVERDVFECTEESEIELCRALSRFTCTVGNQKFEFQDAWEWNCKDYTYRFVWCCYAIAWSIRKYDREQTQRAESAA
jgi:hypothetical protein